MTKTVSSTIMVVDLCVEPARRAEFDVFYHNDYIPQFLAAVPLVVTARRYAQMDGGDVDAANKRFFTIYELHSDDSMDKIDAAIARSAHKNASDRFKLWKDDGLTHFDRAFYKEIQRHPSEIDGWPWNSGYLCVFLWTVEAGVPASDALAKALEYAVSVMKDAPRLLIASRTYARLSSQAQDFMTVFEVSHPKGLLKLSPVFGEWMAPMLSSNQMFAMESFYFYSV